MSTVRLEGTTLYMPAKNPATLTTTQAAILEACDGVRTPKQIAAEILTRGEAGAHTESDIYATLHQLEAAGLIAWTLEACIEPYPERTLRRLFTRIGDEQLRAEA